MCLDIMGCVSGSGVFTCWCGVASRRCRRRVTRDKGAGPKMLLWPVNIGSMASWLWCGVQAVDVRLWPELGMTLLMVKRFINIEMRWSMYTSFIMQWSSWHGRM